MEMEMEIWRDIPVPREEVDIAAILMSGQSFRWRKNEGSPDEIVGVFGHRLWILKQTPTHILYKVYCDEGDSKDTLAMDEMLHNYFQLDVKLLDLYKDWASKDPRFAKLTKEEYGGIRILRQDPVETIFSFICSSNNNIQRISGMVDKLCSNYGRKIVTYKDKDYYDFPQVEKLAGDNVEMKLRKESFGYRAGYIAKTAQQILENGGVSWVEGLKKLSYEEARAELQKLCGIGRKVADCICLMSLGFAQAIPVDTHIHQVARTYLPNLPKTKTLTDKLYTEITDHFRSMHGDYAGWAQSVLFASRLRHLKTDIKASGRKRRQTSGEQRETNQVDLISQNDTTKGKRRR